ncbi:DUF4397 domain-containing protein [Frigoribacterium sp. CG_9.8]|uniref:DUF4397 domain-containing protein n=1 Tax=Frigoribacterium sp. CG_9.8 TaxID=2787733 RepID=UPI0018CB7D0D|nr:DUF4397 domain-containing protein [Frigoribacterium sp. CG_9.8]MBG6108564.1 hypothetical protein [Frigoribacterium sp. CG_9.8]
MKTRIMAGGVAGAFILAALAVPMSASAATNAQLSVLHGIPGVTVDVWVNGKLTIDDFKTGTLAGPLSLAPATYSVAITASDATSATDKVVIGPVDLPLADGGNYTAVAHLTTDNKPTATLFTNDISKTAAGEGRLTVRHVAAAPAVDVLAGSTPVIEGLTNPKEQILNLAPATISASVVAAGTTTPALIGPADVPVVEGQNTIVYAYGSLEGENLAVAVQTITGLHTPPTGIPAGQTGEAARAESTQQTQSAVGIGALGLLLAAAAAAVVVVARRNAGSRA